VNHKKKDLVINIIILVLIIINMPPPPLMKMYITNNNSFIYSQPKSNLVNVPITLPSSLNSGMISRINNAKAGCGSCGRH
jgi:hypothetical protein